MQSIPCPHGVAALHYKQYEPIHYVASCYNKETYLRTYEYVIQPMNNMNMWPPSINPTVQPPAVKQLPGRPSKARRKEANETKRTGKLSKCGAVMTCSNCHTKGYNRLSYSSNCSNSNCNNFYSTTGQIKYNENGRGRGRAKGRGMSQGSQENT